MRKGLSRRERNRQRAAANGAPLEPSLVVLYRAYQDACEVAEQAALTDLYIASGQPDFEPAFAQVAVDPSPPGKPRFRCTPMYMGEAVGPTREVRIDD